MPQIERSTCWLSLVGLDQTRPCVLVLALSNVCLMLSLKRTNYSNCGFPSNCHVCVSASSRPQLGGLAMRSKEVSEEREKWRDAEENLCRLKRVIALKQIWGAWSEDGKQFNYDALAKFRGVCWISESILKWFKMMNLRSLCRPDLGYEFQWETQDRLFIG